MDGRDMDQKVIVKTGGKGTSGNAARGGRVGLCIRAILLIVSWGFRQD